MSIHLIEAAGAYHVESPGRLLEEALAVHGFRIASRKTVRGAAATKPGTLRWSRRRLPRTVPFIRITDRETGLGPAWWTTLSNLLDGFVVGYEKWEYRDVHRIVCNLSGKLLEDEQYLPDYSPDKPDAHTLWGERFAVLFASVAGAQEEAAVLEAEDWWLEPCEPHAAPARCSGGRGLLAGVEEARFREVAANGLDGWRWRPWMSSLEVPAIDLWRPAGPDPDRIKAWAKEFDKTAVAWNVDGDEWPWDLVLGADVSYEGQTRDVVDLMKQLRVGTTALGEEPAAVGGRGLAGWRS